MEAQNSFQEELLRQHENARVKLSNIKIEMNSYDKVINLVKSHIAENLSVRKRLSINKTNSKDDEKRRAILEESYDKLKVKLERFKNCYDDREQEYKRRMSEKKQIEAHIHSNKLQMACIKKLHEPLSELQQQEQYQEHQQPQVTGNTDNDKRQTQFDFGVETINFLNECNWNLGSSCDRSLAETLLSCFPTGTFLVRSSKTRANSFALSVVANSAVRHCLIDQNDQGEFYFHPPGPNRQIYSTLCDLVMDYRQKSLITHNPELDTNLIFPVLSQLKKTSNKGHN